MSASAISAATVAGISIGRKSAAFSQALDLIDLT
jgi:hypothetical protein